MKTGKKPNKESTLSLSMKPAKGVLKNNSIIVSDTKDVGRLYTKSKFGKTTSDNTLTLSFIEAAYLLDERKIRVFKNQKEVTFEQLVNLAAIQDPSFETKFIIFQNLRNRGQQITLCNKESDFTFFFHRINQEKKEKKCYVLAYSERNIPQLTHLKRLINQAKKNHSETWIAIADEEGDVTYYHITDIHLQGETITKKYPEANGMLLQDRVLVFNEKIAKLLHNNEFFGKPFGNGLQLSLVEAIYLANQKMLHITDPETKKILTEKKMLNLFSTHQPDISLRIALFYDLKQKGMIVKTGFKFGTHFRAYTKSPHKSHAEYLIHGVTDSFTTSWAEISRAVRLAHSVNKTFAFAIYTSNRKKITYISLSRLRP